MAEASFGVVFDCDGTLVDSMGSWREVERDLARRAGVPLTKDLTDLVNTLTIPETARYFHEELGLGDSAEDVTEIIDDAMMVFYSQRCEPRPGALEFVVALHERGIPMSIASSTPKHLLMAGIEHAGFAPYMETVLSVDDVGHAKREPVVYDAAREAMGTTRENTWGAEDAAYALVTLRTAGFRTIGVYDCDLSGTVEQLQDLSDVFYRSFEEADGAVFPSRA